MLERLRAQEVIRRERLALHLAEVVGVRQDQNLDALRFAVERCVGLSGFCQLAYLLWCKFDRILWFQARNLNTPFTFAICLGMFLLA